MHPRVEKFVAMYGRLPTEFDPDYLELLRMSKYRIIPVPDFKPGKCANCGTTKNDGRDYIDFGLEVDWYGIVYLCGYCLKDIAKEMGLFKDLETLMIKQEIEIARLQDLKGKGAELHENIMRNFDEVKAFYAHLFAVGNDSPTDGSDRVVPPETTVEPTINETESGTTKSSTGSGRKNVSSLADLLNSSPGD